MSTPGEFLFLDRPFRILDGQRTADTPSNRGGDDDDNKRERKEECRSPYAADEPLRWSERRCCWCCMYGLRCHLQARLCYPGSEDGLLVCVWEGLLRVHDDDDDSEAVLSIKRRVGVHNTQLWVT